MQLKHFLYMTTAGLMLTFISCKKDQTNDPDPSQANELNTHADDQAQFSVAVDGITEDANKMMEANLFFSGKTLNIQTICDATIAIDTISNPKTITITYLGTNCLGNYTRTGKVILSMPAGMYWSQQGAVLTVTYENLKITRLSDNKSIVINGDKLITNITGGKLYQLPAMGTIIHTIGSNNMNVKFPDSTTRNWNIARKRTFSYNNGVVLTVTGNHSAGGYSGICEWGTNRMGHPFVTTISEPLIVRQDCNFRLTHGQITHHVGQMHGSVTYGLDANGHPTGCPASGHYYLKIVVEGPNGVIHSAIHPY